MTAEDRRKSIMHYLKTSSGPVSASLLAANFNVSRQIIVGDIALLRAKGTTIYATPRGYISGDSSANSTLRTISCKHDEKLMEQELNICIDHGCKVLNVIVEHPIYGELTGELQLTSRFDIQEFIRKVRENKVHSLCELTNDIHLHTLECPDQEAYERVCEELAGLGILTAEPEKDE